MKYSVIFLMLVIIMEIGCSGDAPGKKNEPLKKQEPDLASQEVDTFKNTADRFPEYSTFEMEDLGFDPCELLTMHGITVSCKPTSTVSIYNHRQNPEKVCIYSWEGTDGQLCEVKFTILGYTLSHGKLVSLFKPDKDGIIQHSDYGIRWIVDNKVMSVSYTGELIKKVNILTVKNHVKPLKKAG